ncbi:MAG: hypothetical protein PHY48_09570 [Candidatus Cloacimonetes bacterium]|nr:hypothetical protein [Candidatus Cloacimonadota bacterium]
MTQISPTIKLFTYRESYESGLQIMSFMFSHNCNNYHLQGRTTDTIYIFTESIGIYVLTVNKGLGYMGLNSYMAPEPDPINSIILHNCQEIKETLGAKWKGMKPIAIVQKLISCLY